MPLNPQPVDNSPAAVAWRELVAAMLTAKNAAGVQRSLQTVVLWATTENARQHALIEGMLGAIVRAMASFSGDVALLAAACQAIIAVTRNGNVRKQVACDAGALGAIVAAIESHGLECVLLEDAFSTLDTLFGSADGQRERLGMEAGVPRALVAAMRDHVDRPVLQQLGCRAVCSLAAPGDLLAASATSAALVAAGALDAIVRAMSTHAEDAKVQEDGCLALSALVSRSDARRSAAVEAGAALPCISAIERHGVASPQLAAFAFNALGELANGADACRLALLDAGAISVVGSALAAHAAEQSAAVAIAAFRLLGALLVVADRGAQQQPGSACVRLVAQAMATHGEDAQVQQAALGSLLRLAVSSKACRQAAASREVVRELVAAMLRHPQHASVQTWGCACAYVVATDGNGARVALVEGGALQAVLGAMASHRSSLELTQFGLQAVAQIARGPVEGSVLEAGGVKAAVRALDLHAGSARCCQLALVLLLLVVKDRAEGRQALAEAGAAPLLKAVRKAHGEQNLSLCTFTDVLSRELDMARKARLSLAIDEPRSRIGERRPDR